jgi:hypothetical protein
MSRQYWLQIAECGTDVLYKARSASDLSFSAETPWNKANVCIRFRTSIKFLPIDSVQ